LRVEYILDEDDEIQTIELSYEIMDKGFVIGKK
jgi:predicted RNA-binding protein YlqC (UPF0109 family)